MNMATTATTTSWAKLKYGPTEPKSSKGYTPQHSACVQLLDRGSEETWIYFSPGLYSYLQEGDTFVCNWKKGKWRLDTATPELRAMLEKRMQAAQAIQQSLTMSVPQSTSPGSSSIQSVSPDPSSETQLEWESPSVMTRSDITSDSLPAVHADVQTYCTLMLRIQSELIRGATTQRGEVGITATQLENYAIAIFNKVTK